MPQQDDTLTCTYKDVDGNPVELDVYLPQCPPSSTPKVARIQKEANYRTVSVPTVVYFHGGGLTVGNRRSWFPTWLYKRINALGYIFVSADYSLMPPSTGHDILADIKDVFTFVSESLNGHLDKHQYNIPTNSKESHTIFYVDPNAIAVAGTSAGGLCAYLAAIHATPKPKAVVSMYAMGGDFLTPHYLTPKTTPFLRGREILDPSLFSQYLYPFNDLPPTSDSPLSYHPPTSTTPGYPANDRMLIGRLQLQLGVLLDYYTGEHEPSISASLREPLEMLLKGPSNLSATNHSYLQHFIPEEHSAIFPQCNITPDWPPTYLVHGTKDTAIPPQDSHNMYALLRKAGVEVKMLDIEGKEHSFDYEPNVEVIHEHEFDLIVDFLRQHLDKDN